VKTGNKKTRITTLIISIVIVSILGVVFAFFIREDTNRGIGNNTTPVEEMELPIEEKQEYVLEDGLKVTDLASYAGVYMEDGTDEIVEDVMMIILMNTSEKDLQFAAIDITYEGFVAEFEASSVPAGESVVLLEKNRHEMVEEEPGVVEAKGVLFFEESMNLLEEIFEVEGFEQGIEIKNISDKDVDEDIFVYYKNSAADLLYGGIIYRARVSGGLKAGDRESVAAAHFSPDNSRILMITVGE